MCGLTEDDLESLRRNLSVLDLLVNALQEQPNGAIPLASIHFNRPAKGSRRQWAFFMVGSPA
jgi:hypothetical protein